MVENWLKEGLPPLATAGPGSRNKTVVTWSPQGNQLVFNRMPKGFCFSKPSCDAVILKYQGKMASIIRHPMQGGW